MAPDEPRALGLRIHALRRAQGLSQRRLADAAGVSHGYIALLERGQLPNPSKFRLDGVARALGLRTSDGLFNGTTDRLIESPESSPANNVLGTVEQVRTSGLRPLPVFRWGSCGDPRDQESPPDPDHLEYPPPGRESLIGPAGFGVVVKGESMSGRGIHDGDVVWVNPDRSYAVGKVVLALASLEGEAAGMVIKTYSRSEVGHCLVSESDTGRSPVPCREFKVIGPVVGITSWRLPS